MVITKTINSIRRIGEVAVVTAILWFALDFAYTTAMGLRGFSVWFAADSTAGRIHTPNFEGRWGGLLDEFTTLVSIGPYGERNSSPFECDDTDHILFVGDSTTAGFEVNDHQTFSSNINSSCHLHGHSATNLGVRGNDTHSALGIYLRNMGDIPHQTLFYLMTVNDLWENLDPNEYFNLTRHFGRFYNAEVIKFQKSWLTGAYLSFRIFISDNFYFTTKLLAYISNLSKKRGPAYNSPEETVRTARAGIPKLVDLIGNARIAVTQNSARLVLAFYPCVYQGETTQTELNVCGQHVALEENIASEIVNSYNDVVFIKLSALTERYIRKGCFSRESLTFERDRHLSAFGHLVIGEIIRKHLLNETSSSFKTLC